ncbi:MAG: DUF599 domain-containing protein [Paracoccaceae bacterium]
MIWIDRALLFSPLDYGSLIFLVLAWLLIGWRIEHSSTKKPSTSHLMAEYRRAWMVEMITREPRIFDAQIVSSLRQGTAFFASTALISLGGVLAVLGNTERLTIVASELSQIEAPVFVWEIKLLIIALFLTNAFLKFVWANRLFGYTSVIMAAVPNDLSDPSCAHKAYQSGELNILAAQSFNRGLRAVYFGLASAAWLGGPYALIGATMVTLLVIWRREFASRSRKVMLDTGS